jgi:hypothetical protein
VVEFGYRDLRSRWRPLHSQVQLMRLCIFNLLQWWHSFLDVAVQTFLRASGVVPSAELGCHVLRSSAGCDRDEGLDGVFHKYVKGHICKISRPCCTFNFY